MILHIDTTDRDELIVRLLDDQENVLADRREARGRNHAQHLLPIIDEALQKQKSRMADLKSITVNTGPGSFTGTRVGVAVANALGFALGIPVNGESAGKTKPVYDREPNISKPRERQGRSGDRR